MTKPRYARLPLGLPELLLGAGVPLLGVVLYLRIRLHTAKRSIPGLLAFGEAGLSESLDLKCVPTRRLLKTLEPRFVLFDRPNRLLYTLGAIEQDGPTTINSVMAFAKQWRELPTESRVTREVARAITAVLADNKYPELRTKWLAETKSYARPRAAGRCDVQSASDSKPDSASDCAPDSTSDSASQSELDSRSDSTSLPISDVRDPETEAAAAPDSATVDRFRRAWCRLPRPPFAVAAEADIERAVEEIPIADFNVLVQQLASSKWVTGTSGLKVTPTLRKVVDQPEYRDRIVNGEFASTSLRWRCPDCSVDHAPTEPCPPMCQGCHRAHPPEQYCKQLRERELREELALENSPRLCEKQSEAPGGLSNRYRFTP